MKILKSSSLVYVLCSGGVFIEGEEFQNEEDWGKISDPTAW